MEKLSFNDLVILAKSVFVDYDKLLCQDSNGRLVNSVGVTYERGDKSITFLVRVNESVKLDVPCGSLELIVLCALHAGSDVCILLKDNSF